MGRDQPRLALTTSAGVFEEQFIIFLFFLCFRGKKIFRGIRKRLAGELALPGFWFFNPGYLRGI